MIHEREMVLQLPQSVSSNYEGYRTLLNLCNPFLDKHFSNQNIVLDFQYNTWFEANLLPVLFAYMVEGHKIGVVSKYRNSNEAKFTDLLIRNGFAKLCFGKEHKPHQKETCVPFNVFNANDTYNFGSYIDAELPRFFPAMQNDVKRDLSKYIQEIFGNAQIHGGSEKVFTCGQFYPTYNKMDFTIVDLGYTFSYNVEKFFKDRNGNFTSNSIEWAVQPEHSTKSDISGGFGLTLMRDFIGYNKGKFQIVSGNEYWELVGGNEHTNHFERMFPGTIANIEIDQSDKKYYYYEECHETSDDIF